MIRNTNLPAGDSIITWRPESRLRRTVEPDRESHSQGQRHVPHRANGRLKRAASRLRFGLDCLDGRKCSSWREERAVGPWFGRLQRCESDSATATMFTMFTTVAHADDLTVRQLVMPNMPAGDSQKGEHILPHDAQPARGIHLPF